MRIAAVSSSGIAAFESAREGMRGAERRFNHAANVIAKGDVNAEPMVDLLISKGVYAANAKVVKTYDEMIGTLLDERG